MNHRELSQRCRVRNIQRQARRQRLNRTAKDDIVVGKRQQSGGLSLYRRFASLGGSWTFLSGHVFLGKALFPGLALPIIVPNPSAVDYHTTAKLAEHRPGGDDGDLTRTVGVWENVLLDKVVFLDLRSNNFVQRAILVEKQVRVTIIQHSRALSRKHKQLGASIRDTESAAFVFAAT